MKKVITFAFGVARAIIGIMGFIIVICEADSLENQVTTVLTGLAMIMIAVVPTMIRQRNIDDLYEEVKEEYEKSIGKYNS